jgi:hypothetical protein
MQEYRLIAMQTNAMSPPVGFRKAIPMGVKIRVVLAQDSRCPTCGERLGDFEGVEFDHVPALGLRGWDPEAGDTVPAANDPGAMQAKHADCHAAKTTGRRGESKLSRVGGDTSEIAKLRRLERKSAEFRQSLLSKDVGEPKPATPPKRKTVWPKRKFPSRSA